MKTNEIKELRERMRREDAMAARLLTSRESRVARLRRMRAIVACWAIMATLACVVTWVAVVWVSR